jgi:hypothetical protein
MAEVPEEDLGSKWAVVPMMMIMMMMIMIMITVTSRETHILRNKCGAFTNYCCIYEIP